LLRKSQWLRLASSQKIALHELKKFIFLICLVSEIFFKNATNETTLIIFLATLNEQLVCSCYRIKTDSELLNRKVGSFNNSATKAIYKNTNTAKTCLQTV